MLKAHFVLEIYTFLPWIFGYATKRLGEKAKVKFKIYDGSDWTKIITIHILLSISNCKGNQPMRIGQFVKYNVRNNFHAEKEAGRLVADLFLILKKAL